MCIHKKSKITVAMKIYDKTKLHEAARKKSVEREIILLKKLNHDGIVKFYDSFETRNTVSFELTMFQINIVMEHVSGKSLF